MGKVRINTIGDENLEQKQKIKTEKRKEAKKVTKEREVSDVVTSETPAEPTKPQEAKEKKKQPQKKSVTTKKVRSKHYVATAKLVEKNKLYSLNQALELLPKLQRTKFDEAVELHINTNEVGVSGNVTLPHGTGKKINIAVISPSRDQKAADDLIKKIESGGVMDFDILIATPDAMPKLAKVARILGPKGLMPNPKNGTVTMKPDDLVKKYEAGQINFKTELKSPVMHLIVGKVSFGKEKLEENITTALDAVQAKNIKNITLKSTMSPGIKIQAA